MADGRIGEVDTGKSYYQYRCWRMCPLVDFFPWMCQMTGAHGTLAGRGEYWSRKREEMSCQLLRKVPMSKKKILLIFQQAALARPKGVQPVVSNHRLSAAFSFS